MSSETEQKYIFYRMDRGAPLVDAMPSRMDEKRARTLIGACIRNVDKAITSLKRGKPVQTRYATYTAEPI